MKVDAHLEFFRLVTSAPGTKKAEVFTSAFLDEYTGCAFLIGIRQRMLRQPLQKRLQSLMVPVVCEPPTHAQKRPDDLATGTYSN
jgi:hypothetical protein